jgi:hypothetical protein
MTLEDMDIIFPLSYFSGIPMCKKNERLIYMAEALIISGGNYFDGNVEFQEKEDDKVVLFVWRNLIFRVIFSCKLIVRFSCSFAG